MRHAWSVPANVAQLWGCELHTTPRPSSLLEFRESLENALRLVVWILGVLWRARSWTWHSLCVPSSSGHFMTLRLGKWWITHVFPGLVGSAWSVKWLWQNFLSTESCFVSSVAFPSSTSSFLTFSLQALRLLNVSKHTVFHCVLGVGLVIKWCYVSIALFPSGRR